MATDLIDPHGRTVRDLRISVTDRCSFRCTYCMPSEGMVWLPRTELLTFEEIEVVARVCVERFGFTGLRVTGGEPTLRAHLPALIAKLAALGTDLSMTTNGATLPAVAEALHAAGLRRVNISLDSLQADRFLRMAGRDRLADVLAGIDAALDAGFAPVKVNAVLVKGENDDEVLDLAAFGRDKGITMRFIEYMPLDAQHEWGADRVVTSAEVIAAISARWPLERVPSGSAPAARWRYVDGAGEVGVVASVTESFCSTCDRVRITAEGMFRSCLFAHTETDLRIALRGGGTAAAVEARVAAAIVADVGTKWAGHQIGNVSFLQPRRAMSQIGG